MLGQAYWLPGATTHKETTMAFYENVFIVRQDVSNEQVEGLTTRFTEILESGGGKVEKTEFWGLRTMAYKIKKNRKGHYVMLNLDSPAPAVKEMERNMQLSEDVIRHMTLRVDELEEEPSAVMKFRGERTRSYSKPSGSSSIDAPKAATGASDAPKAAIEASDAPKAAAEASDAPKAATEASDEPKAAIEASDAPKVVTEPAADPAPEKPAVATEGASE
jgi:small subunit ribosomal protein S6